jgi:transposase
MFAARMSFVLGIPHRVWIDELYAHDREKIFQPFNRHDTGENEALYVLTHPRNWKGHRCYVHIFFNNFAAAAEADAFDLNLTRWRDELVSGNEKKENERFYKKYFIVKETPKRGRKVTENEMAVSEARNKYSGFFSVMTTRKMEATEALEIYRRKEAVENCFDDLKNTLDMKRLRIHLSQAMDSRLFIQFVSLILLSRVRQIVRGSPVLKRLGVRDVMEAMETIVEVRYSGRYGSIVTEADPLQRDIIETFGISIKI